MCRSSGHLSALKSFEPKNTELLRVMPPSQLFKKSSPPFRVTYSLGREISVQQQHHLYDELSFDFKTPLELEHAIMIAGEPSFFTVFLRIIPIVLPDSTRRPTSPNHQLNSLIVLPSGTKSQWYSACLLELNRS